MAHRALGLTILATILWTAVAHAQDGPYRAVEAWAQAPAGIQWGQVVGIDVDAAGNVYALHRCGADTCVDRTEPPILKFDPTGRLLASWGSGMFVWPHGIHVAPDGFVWVTDARDAPGRGHQVFKFSPDGEVLMTLGRAGVGGEGEDTLNGPTDVVVATNGDVFVADGHGNNRIVKFSKDGRFLKAWGRRGMAPGEFDVPHGISMDARGRVFVADRDNGRVQLFDQEGRFLEQWTQFGAPSGVYVAGGEILYVAHAMGIRVGSAADGSVAISIDHATALAAAGNIEDVAADAAGNVYAGLADPRTLRKLVKN